MWGTQAHALNYTPGVQVGDVLVFEESYPWGAYDVTHTITVINDSATGTWIYGIISNGYKDDPLGFLTNYTLYPQYVIASYIIGTDIEISGGYFAFYYTIPGTILMDYSDQIVDLFDTVLGASVSCSSIDDGLGIKITGTTSGYSFTYKRTFNEQGILEEETVKATQGTETTRFHVKLKSINGEKYRTIPGFSIYSIIISSMLAIGAISPIITRKK